MRPLQAITLLVFTTFALFGTTQAAKVGDIVITGAWANPLPPVSENGAAFVSFKNHAMHGDRLIAAASPVSTKVEFHTHIKKGLAMMMQKIESVDVQPNAAVMMQPEGLHLMLIGLKKVLKENEHFPMTLTFEKAGTTTVMVQVERRSMSAGQPYMGGSDHSSTAGEHNKHDEMTTKDGEQKLPHGKQKHTH